MISLESSWPIDEGWQILAMYPRVGTGAGTRRIERRRPLGEAWPSSSGSMTAASDNQFECCEHSPRNAAWDHEAARASEGAGSFFVWWQVGKRWGLCKRQLDIAFRAA